MGLKKGIGNYIIVTEYENYTNPLKTEIYFICSLADTSSAGVNISTSDPSDLTQQQNINKRLLFEEKSGTRG